MRPPASPGPFQEGSDAKRARENVIYTIVMVIGLVLQSSRMPSGQIFKGFRRISNSFYLVLQPIFEVVGANSAHDMFTRPTIGR